MVRTCTLHLAVACLIALTSACRAGSDEASGPTTGTTRPASAAEPDVAQPPDREDAMKLTSTAFDHQATVPVRYTCQGADTSPPLAWTGVPEGTRSLALIVEDPDAPNPDAPQMTWIHWVLYNIPADVHGLDEGASRSVPAGTLDGTNSWRRVGYGGPCPPIGEHRYFFRLYALDTELTGLDKPTRDDLLGAMGDHVLAKAELMGRYKKGKK